MSQYLPITSPNKQLLTHKESDVLPPETSIRNDNLLSPGTQEKIRKQKEKEGFTFPLIIKHLYIPF